MNLPIAASFTHPRDLVLMLRPHQWVKNLPLFAPLFLSGHDGDTSSWLASAVAFLAFCLAASGGYYVNDVLDLKHDGSSPAKRHNRVAIGRVPPMTAAFAGGFLIAAGLACALYVNLATALVIAAYAAGSLAYSAWFKRWFLFDCVILAGLFTLRLVAGAAAVDVPASLWLIGFSIPLFLSLALMKRCAQIDSGLPASRLVGRNYHGEDRPVVHGLAISSALIAVMVLTAYVVLGAYEPHFYHQPAWLWGFPVAVAVFLVRIVKVLGRGRLDSDPVAFALRDPPSLAAGAGLVATFLLARGI